MNISCHTDLPVREISVIEITTFIEVVKCHAKSVTERNAVEITVLHESSIS
jgi:hypothetical protein